MTRPLALVALGLVAVALVGIGYERHLRREALEVPIGGGDAGGLPLAQPEDEHLQAAVLERVSRDPAAANLRALLVMRHGHLVFTRFAHGMDVNSSLDMGPAAQVLVALLAGVAVQDHALGFHALGRFEPHAWRAAIERALHASYVQLLSGQIWSRVNAASAWIALPTAGAAVPDDCCLHARVQDWMRIGDLIAEGGRFEGTQIVPDGWATLMRQPNSTDGNRGLGLELAAAAHGGEPFVADDVVFLRGWGHWRLWVSPSMHLAVLFGDRAAGDSDGQAAVGSPSAAARTSASDWDETRLANLVIESATDRSGPKNPNSLLQQLVPHH